MVFASSVELVAQIRRDADGGEPVLQREGLPEEELVRR